MPPPSTSAHFRLSSAPVTVSPANLSVAASIPPKALLNQSVEPPEPISQSPPDSHPRFEDDLGIGDQGGFATPEPEPEPEVNALLVSPPIPVSEDSHASNVKEDTLNLRKRKLRLERNEAHSKRQKTLGQASKSQKQRKKFSKGLKRPIAVNASPENGLDETLPLNENEVRISSTEITNIL